MIVPFLFDLEVTGEYNCLAKMYKLFDMAQKQGAPIIAPERYFKSFKELEPTGIDETWFEQRSAAFEFTMPSQQEIDKAWKICIPASLEAELDARFPSMLDAWIYILQNRYEPLEDFIEQAIAEVEQHGKKIDAFVAVYAVKSLVHVAQKHGIRTVFIENGVLRAPAYHCHTGYFDFTTGIHGKGDAETRYLAFLEQIQKTPLPILSRKEILKQFLAPQWAGDIPLMDEPPAYDICILINHFSLGFQLQYSHMTDLEIQRQARKKYSEDRILYRGHPGVTEGHIKNSDTSPTSFHAICKCGRVAGIMSGMLFETMLVGRVPCSYGETPFSFMCNKGVNDPNEAVAPLEFVNFGVFGYQIPWEWIDDVEYYRFRLSGPPETEIYRKHFNYYMNGGGSFC